MSPQKQIHPNGTQQLTETEHIISGIWSEILQQEKVNPEDNFFELGGDSLMTMMVMFKVNDGLAVELPPGAIMEAPTLREFCVLIDNNKNTAKKSDLVEEGYDSMAIESGVI